MARGLKPGAGLLAAICGLAYSRLWIQKACGKAPKTGFTFLLKGRTVRKEADSVTLIQGDKAFRWFQNPV